MEYKFSFKKTHQIPFFSTAQTFTEILRSRTLPTGWDAFIFTNDRLFCITNGKAFGTAGKEILSRRNHIIVKVICTGLLKVSVQQNLARWYIVS